jgi:hypothetical protein
MTNQDPLTRSLRIVSVSSLSLFFFPFFSFFFFLSFLSFFFPSGFRFMDHLQVLKTKIESWEKFYQIGALRILHNRERSKLNENRNGIFVNLICISQETVQELQKYVDYVDEQTSQLKTAENTKDRIKDAFFDHLHHENSNKY